MKDFDDIMQLLNDRPVFKGYFARYLGGNAPTKNELTYEVMKALWSDELVADKYISIVFNTPLEDVHKMREEYGINRKSCILGFMGNFSSILGKAGSAIMMV